MLITLLLLLSFGINLTSYSFPLCSIKHTKCAAFLHVQTRQHSCVIASISAQPDVNEPPLLVIIEGGCAYSSQPDLIDADLATACFDDLPVRNQFPTKVANFIVASL